MEFIMHSKYHHIYVKYNCQKTMTRYVTNESIIIKQSITSPDHHLGLQSINLLQIPVLRVHVLHDEEHVVGIDHFLDGQ